MKAHTCQQLVLVATLLAPLTTLSAQALPAGVRLQPDGGRTGILFGTAVSISGSSIATGAAFDANGMFGGAGSVFVHVRDGGGAWTLQQRLVANDSAANDNLGAWVEIFGDTLFASAPSNVPAGSPKSGAVYVFRRSAGVWTQIDKLVPNPAIQGANFGQRMAVDDEFLLLGGLNAGSQRIVHVYQPVAGAWQQTGSFQPTGAGSFASHISLWKKTALVGASGATNASAVATGAAYVFDHNGSAFAQTIKLLASDGASGDAFGFSVSLWGKRAVIGAFQDDIGNNVNQGSAYVFELGANGWTEVIKLTAPDGLGNDEFGKDVRICGDRIFVGASRRDEGVNPDQGAMYRYDRIGGVWSFVEKVTLASPGRSNALYGDHIGVDAQGLVVGAPFISESYAYSGGCKVDGIHADSFE